MPKTYNVPSATYPVGTTQISAAGQTVFPYPAGNNNIVQVQLATPTDWTTGTAGREIGVLVQKSFDNGVTWSGGVQGSSPLSPGLAKDGVSLPTVTEMDIGSDPNTTVYQAFAVVSGGAVTCGFTLNLTKV